MEIKVGEKITAEITHREIMDNKTDSGTHCPMAVAMARILNVPLRNEAGISMFGAGTIGVNYWGNGYYQAYIMAGPSNNKSVFRYVLIHKEAPWWTQAWRWIIEKLGYDVPGVKITITRSL